MSEPPIRYARTVDGLHIAYQVVGDGPFDLVYAPGWLSNLECVWEMPDLGDFLSELARFTRLILFDRRGFGLSDWPAAAGATSMEVGMDDIRAVLDAARSKRAVLFGYDDGGALCTMFAASYPSRTMALVLFGTWATYFRTHDYPWGWTQEQGDAIWQLIEDHWGTEEYWTRDSSQVSPRIAGDLRRVRAWARYQRLSASPGAAIAAEQMYMETDIRGLLGAVAVPTLVMHRAEDTAERVEQAHYIGERIPGAKVVVLPGDEHAPFVGNADLVLRELQTFCASISAEEDEFDRMLATVLFTDIVGSTDKLADLGDHAWRDLVEQHHSRVRGLLARYRGTEVDTAGDGFFATFDGPARAVRCALAIIHDMALLGLEIRVGVHTGEAQVINGKVGGMAVNIGARVAGVADPSEVLVSSTVRDLTAGSGLRFEDAGEHALKGIPDPWRLYRAVEASS
jgi:class 3 adenylate cyclase/pimeloyl-ACP methyl ester carboxylesterase